MNDEEWLRLSLLQHFAYCPRQAQLLLDGVWEDNRFTIEGQAAHQRVDFGPTDRRRGLTVYHSVDVASEKLKIFGVADSVEEDSDGNLCPVEHKHGRGAGNLFPSTVHVVAQALCLEEMTGKSVIAAAIYVTTEHRRVDLDVEENRSVVEDTIVAARDYLLNGKRTEFIPQKSLCKSCSVNQACQPFVGWEE